MPKFPRHVKGILKLHFSNGQAVEVKLYSTSPCALSAKIQPTLCAKLDSVTPDQKLPVYIIFLEPVFHVPGCEDRAAPPPDPKLCSSAEIDSETAYWTVHKSEVVRLFSAFSLYDTGNTNRRLDSMAFNFTRLYAVSATKSTILAIATESSVVGIELIVPPRMLSIKQNNSSASRFPFSLRNNNILAALRRGNLNAASITVYSMTGKNITAAATNEGFVGKTGIVIVKIIDKGKAWYSKKMLVR
jgi:hypothetical protein